MTVKPRSDPEQQLQRGGDELEERLHRVDEDIDEAKKQLRARREGDGPRKDTAGDWEDTDDDDDGGEDPAAFDDPEDLDGESDDEE
jgi:hypothetical protein